MVVIKIGQPSLVAQPRRVVVAIANVGLYKCLRSSYNVRMVIDYTFAGTCIYNLYPTNSSLL